jgi:L-ascorbate metabolism protein UlaG (beta-lactamase superfamily)
MVWLMAQACSRGSGRRLTYRGWFRLPGPLPTVAEVSGRQCIRWLGHGSVLVELDGMRIVVDPVFRTRVAHLRRHLPAPSRPLTPLDAILITHRHYDHLDLPSLSRLPHATLIVAPHAAVPLLRRRKLSNLVPVDVGDSVELGAVRVLAIHAEHDGGRLRHSAASAALGYVIQGSRRVYLAGDTGLFAGMADLGPLDAAAIPVWGWGSSLGPGHMGPDDAAAAIVLLDPRLAVPIHYGTYAPIGMAAPTPEPALRFARLVAEGPTGCEVVIPEVGEPVDLERA